MGGVHDYRHIYVCFVVAIVVVVTIIVVATAAVVTNATYNILH